ncbi:transcriptional regulator [Vallitalea longa]|uniref:Transcriptional regulator n=1 Tax=Vallitalea longa TaxID=2936439 RepID=A0A9W5YAB6_9FIRM|nr:helix-turn-helix transcriptional regulator [Vallitalea longa]GKX28299.1 transcriptional regulator [Vallitalea longa]
MYDRIKSLREDNDFTQKEIAKILNCSQTGYGKYELGQRDIPTHILIKLALHYKTSIDYILGLTDVKKPYSRS